MAVSYNPFDPNVLACATQGHGGDDESRLTALVSGFTYTLANISKKDKRKSGQALLKQLKSRHFDLLLLEGTGIAGGLAAILGRKLYGIPYVISSGDAVAPFLSGRHPWAGAVFRSYEYQLCAHASGFIGWTPYLVGRALTLGTPRGITIPGWAPFELTTEQLQRGRHEVRQRLGVDEGTIIFGIVGALNWSDRYSYCYGAELIRAAQRSSGHSVVVVVGDGTGLSKLRELAGTALGRTIHLPGRVPRNEIPAWLAALDVGSIPQSVDGVGGFRYTTKLSEYQAAHLPFITNQIPMAYDLDEGQLWRLPGQAPWDQVFVDELTALMNRLTMPEVAMRRRSIKPSLLFDRSSQVHRVAAFLRDVIDAERLRRLIL